MEAMQGMHGMDGMQGMKGMNGMYWASGFTEYCRPPQIRLLITRLFNYSFIQFLLSASGDDLNQLKFNHKGHKVLHKVAQRR